MYCNNCGKEVADNMKFCIHCGAKIEAADKPAPKGADAKCSRCGKPVENALKFCTYCGEPVHSGAAHVRFMGERAMPSSSAATSDPGGILTVLISALMFSAMGVIYLVTAIKASGTSLKVFDMLSSGNAALGFILHWCICAAVMVDCIQGLYRISKAQKKGSCIVQTSISLLTITFLLWICRLIWNDLKLEGASIILYTTFAIYGKIIAVSFILPAVAFACGIVCAKSEQK